MIIPAARWRVTMPLPMRIGPHELDAPTRDSHVYQAYRAAPACGYAARARLGRPDGVADRAAVGYRRHAIGLHPTAACDLLHGAGLGGHGAGADLAGVCVSTATLTRVRRT